jgi:hypothetical protein
MTEKALPSEETSGPNRIDGEGRIVAQHAEDVVPDVGGSGALAHRADSRDLPAPYAGFLVSLTLHLQESLGFSPLEAGLTFAAYASGFATVSLTWTRTGATVRHRLPIAGPLVMAAALLALGLIARGGRWPVALTMPLLLCGGPLTRVRSARSRRASPRSFVPSRPRI